MRPLKIIIGSVIGLIVGLVGLMLIGWIFAGNDFFMYKFFAPRQEAVRRQVYEQTKSYRQGSVQRLNTLCVQISDADGDHKPMLQAVVAQEFAEWDTDDVPDYLRRCLTAARGK